MRRACRRPLILRPPHFRVMTSRAHWTRRNERGPASAARRPHQFLFPEERFEPEIADRLRCQFLSPFKDRKRACAAGAAEIVSRAQAQVPVRHLSRAGLLPQLFPYLDQLRDTRRSHGMTLAFQPAGGVDRLRPVQPGRALAGGPASLSRAEEAEILDMCRISAMEKQSCTSANCMSSGPRSAMA